MNFVVLPFLELWTLKKKHQRELHFPNPRLMKKSLYLPASHTQCRFLFLPLSFLSFTLSVSISWLKRLRIWAYFGQLTAPLQMQAGKREICLTDASETPENTLASTVSGTGSVLRADYVLKKDGLSGATATRRTLYSGSPHFQTNPYSR